MRRQQGGQSNSRKSDMLQLWAFFVYILCKNHKNNTGERFAR